MLSEHSKYIGGGGTGLASIFNGASMHSVGRGPGQGRLLNFEETVDMEISSGASELQQSAQDNRRRAERFSLRQGAYVLFYKSDDRKFQIVGQIIDISFSGFSFYYIGTGEDAHRLVYDYDYDIIIFSLYRMLRLKRYKIIYDIELTAVHSGRISARRCGIKLDRLKQSQKLELEQIIRFNVI